jgi:hypothetical protein
VTGTANVTLRDAQVEIVALHIYELAYRTMEVVTRRLVDAELERLRGHRPDCTCGSPCQIAREVRASRVFWIASRWQNSIVVKRVRGAGPG